MAGKKAQDNSKKAAGNARKAESAAKKNAASEAQREEAEGDKWQQGSKNNSKKYVRMWCDGRIVLSEAVASHSQLRVKILAPFFPGRSTRSTMRTAAGHLCSLTNVAFSLGRQRPLRKPRPQRRKLKRTHWLRRRRLV